MEDEHSRVPGDEAAVSAPGATMGSPVKRPPRRPLIEVGLPVLAIGILVLILPFFLPSFVSSLVTKMMIYGLFGMSLNIIWGYAGIPSFGHAAFFGVGGYAAGVFVLKVGISNFWLSLLAGHHRHGDRRRNPWRSCLSGVRGGSGQCQSHLFPAGHDRLRRDPVARGHLRSGRSRAVPPVWPVYRSPK